MPDTLTIQRVFAKQHRRHNLLEDACVHSAEVAATRAVVGANRQQGLHGVVLGPRVAVAIRVSDDVGTVAELLDGDGGDFHDADARVRRRTTLE